MTILIIGGGIQGITTGIVLESLGHDTIIKTEYIPYDDGIDGDEIHSLATNYAAASVYPTKVQHHKTMDALLEEANICFGKLMDTNLRSSISEQIHFGLSEEAHDIKCEDKAPKDCHDIERYPGKVPKRENKDINGVYYKEYFVEMPEYVPNLYDTYKNLGGTVIKEKVSKEDVIDNDYDYSINCTGYWSRELFNDKSMKAKRGHIVKLKHRKLRNYLGDNFAYTYETDDNKSVYMYSRKNNILFGGTKQPGTPNPESEEWNGEKSRNTIRIDEKEVPERVIKVNEEILSNYLNIDFDRENYNITYGYRPYREKGVRIEKDGDIIHNYGHGGSGVTLSWSSAREAYELLEQDEISAEKMMKEVVSSID